LSTWLKPSRLGVYREKAEFQLVDRSSNRRARVFLFSFHHHLLWYQPRQDPLLTVVSTAASFPILTVVSTAASFPLLTVVSTAASFPLLTVVSTAASFPLLPGINRCKPPSSSWYQPLQASLILLWYQLPSILSSTSTSRRINTTIGSDLSSHFPLFQPLNSLPTPAQSCCTGPQAI
jgi:hypothetical protein